MFHSVSQEELRAYCRNCIESFETWARRLIHERMVEKYGNNYVDAISDSGEHIIKKEIRDHIHQMIEKEPSRFSRATDTLFAEHIVYFLCNPKWYKELFKPAMDYAYPQGCEEARVYLTRLIPIRNALSHANPISIRQAEQAICYTHDFIDGIKQFYKDRGEDRMWNVPKIIRATDSRGKEMFPPSETTSQFNVIIQPENEVGDTYSVQIEVDSSFPPDSYSIRWSIRGKEITEYKNQKHFSITFSTAEIGQVLIVNCKLITTREWHRYYDCDDEMNLLFTVLPPTL